MNMTFSEENALFIRDELHAAVDVMYESLRKGDPREVNKCARVLRAQIKDLENTIKEDVV